MCLGNSHGNFQFHSFTTSENIAQSFRGATFWLTLYRCLQYIFTA